MEIEHRFYTPISQPAASVESVTFIMRPQDDASGVVTDVRRVIQEAEPKMAIVRAAPDKTPVDCGLLTEDCRFSECRLPIEIGNCRLRLLIEIDDCGLGPINQQSAIRNPQSAIRNSNPQSAITIRNQQSQSAVSNRTNPQSPIRNPQSIWL